MEFLATVRFGLEAVVARELRALGFEQQRVEDGPGGGDFIPGDVALARGAQSRIKLVSFTGLEIADIRQRLEG